MLDLKPIVQAILKKYTLPLEGIHGIAHWARVLETGVRLSRVTGANIEVVQLFSVFHDSRRETELIDPSHGIRGARFAAKLRGKMFNLNDDDFDLLFVACAGHTDRPTDEDPTVQTCWDADRLDLGRVGIKPDPLWLGEATVDEHSDIIHWADERATFHTTPEWIQRDWEISTSHWKKMIARKNRKETPCPTRIVQLPELPTT
jgi:uncharacterized protein